jgi:hypothetical protein
MNQQASLFKLVSDIPWRDKREQNFAPQKSGKFSIIFIT